MILGKNVLADTRAAEAPQRWRNVPKWVQSDAPVFGSQFQVILPTAHAASVQLRQSFLDYFPEVRVQMKDSAEWLDLASEPTGRIQVGVFECIGSI